MHLAPDSTDIDPDQFREFPPWVRFRTMRRPPPSAPTIRWAPTVSSSSNMRTPIPEELHALFKLMGYAPVARHRTKKITVYRQGDINYLVNEEPGTHGHGFVAAHGPCAPSMAFRVVDAKQAYERALSLGAEPADVSSAQKTLDVPAIKGIGGSLLYFVDRYGAKGSAYDIEFEWLGAHDPRPAGAGLYLSRSPHPQRPSRPHGCLDRLLREALQLPPDPLLRHRGPRLRPVLARADQPRRQDPDSDQRGRRRFRPDRGISEHLSRRGHPAHRLRRRDIYRTVETPARGRPAVHAGAAGDLFREDRRAPAAAWRGRRAAAGATAS